MSAAVRWVMQEEPNGCVCATLAMVLNVSYAQARERLMAEPAPMHDDCYSSGVAQAIIRAAGWVLDRRGRRHKLTPWPPEPFADIHLASVKVHDGSPVYHSVVWLRDGSVLDPMTPDARTLDSYVHVGGITGLQTAERVP